ncbi:MAG: type II secretion system protein [Candidatus Aenigmatarchaeota archaeon]
MKKGISLPIEMIVVIAIAVLVLVVIAAFFVGGTRPLAGAQIEQAYGRLCSMQLQMCGADPSTIAVSGVYDLDQDGVVDDTTTLADVCALKGISVTTTTQGNPCRKSCGCPQ